MYRIDDKNKTEKKVNELFGFQFNPQMFANKMPTRVVVSAIERNNNKDIITNQPASSRMKKTIA